MDSIPEIRNVTVLYADLIGFKKLAAIFQPDDMMAFLNRLFFVMEPAIQDHKGIIDKIVGDGIFVTFNAFEPLTNHQEQAVKAALAIIKAIRNFAQAEEQSIEVGIGIASGQASCGELGTKTFRPRTVVGKVVGRAVQLSERGCCDNKTTLLVDASVFEETISSFEYQQIEEDCFKVNIPII